MVLVAPAANMVIGFGSVAVLGRLLRPDHFGLVAIATSLMVPVSALCDHGMPLALIQRKSPTLSETNAMFWLQCSLFRWRIFASIVAVGSFVVGIQWGVYGLAVAYSIQSLTIRIPAVMYCISGTFVR